MTCIDYMQFGNESIKGAQEWADDEGTSLFCLDDSSGEYTALLMDGVDWVRAQIEAVRIGSALAGRPLRVITPGFPLGVINVGADGSPDRGGDFGNCGQIPCDDPDVAECDGNENKAALGMHEIGRIAVNDRAWFDVHMHYKTVDNAYTTLENMADSTLEAWKGAAYGDFYPEAKMILEFGPKGDDDHEEWSRIEGEMDTLFGCNSGQQFSTWDQLIKAPAPLPEDRGWELAQFEDTGNGAGFDMGDLLDDIFDYEYTAVCYGPCQQGENTGEIFEIAALRASQVKDCTTPALICDTTNQFSPILRYVANWDSCTGLTAGNDDYETLIGSYGVDVEDFEPHCQDGEAECDGCDQTQACPDGS